MARIRSVKPEFFGSEPVGNCSPTSRLLFVALWCMADDDGRAVDNPKIIRGFAFPLDDDIKNTDVEVMLTELHVSRLIMRYEFEGRKYLCVSNFNEHQHPKKRLSSKLPSPPLPHQFPTSSPLVPHRSPTSSPLVPHQFPEVAPVVSHIGACSGSGSGSGSGRVVGEEGRVELQPIADVSDETPPLVLLAQAPKAKKPKGERKYPHFSEEQFRAMFGLWTSTFGAVDAGRFRKEFGPLFTLCEGQRSTDAELLAALRSYVDLAPNGDGAKFASVTRAAGCLAAIAVARRDYAHDPSTRSDVLMRILHGRRTA